MSEQKTEQSRKWMIVCNNPQEKNVTHEEIQKRIAALSSVIYYCGADEIGENGTYHTHIFLQSRSPIRFKRLQKLFPECHLEPSKGTAQQNRDYITKTGKWTDSKKAETSVEDTFFEWGEMKEDKQGQRTDIEEIEELLEDGMTPEQIMSVKLSYRRYSNMIKAAFVARRKNNTPAIRDVQVHYLVGESGSGKSYIYVELCQEYGEEETYLFSDYDGGGWDNYEAQKHVILDELKMQLPFHTLLAWLDKYKIQLHARYANVYALWEHLYITSIYPPEELYKNMVSESLRGRDKQQQLFRRITDITYCFIDNDGKHQRYTIPMNQYVDYEQLKLEALEHFGILKRNAEWITEAEQLPIEFITEELKNEKK